MRRYNVTTVVVAKNIAFQSVMLLAPILVGKVCFVYSQRRAVFRKQVVEMT